MCFECFGYEQFVRINLLNNCSWTCFTHREHIQYVYAPIVIALISFNICDCADCMLLPLLLTKPLVKKSGSQNCLPGALRLSMFWRWNACGIRVFFTSGSHVWRKRLDRYMMMHIFFKQYLYMSWWCRYIFKKGCTWCTKSIDTSGRSAIR